MQNGGNRTVQNQKKPDDEYQPLERGKTGGFVNTLKRQVNAAGSPDSCSFCPPLRTGSARMKQD
jgi:hypothetical protein